MCVCMIPCAGEKAMYQSYTTFQQKIQNLHQYLDDDLTLGVAPFWCGLLTCGGSPS